MLAPLLHGPRCATARTERIAGHEGGLVAGICGLTPLPNDKLMDASGRGAVRGLAAVLATGAEIGSAGLATARCGQLRTGATKAASLAPNPAKGTTPDGPWNSRKVSEKSVSSSSCRTGVLASPAGRMGLDAMARTYPSSCEADSSRRNGQRLTAKPTGSLGHAICVC